jgi:hypothetical protein
MELRCCPAEIGGRPRCRVCKRHEGEAYREMRVWVRRRVGSHRWATLAAYIDPFMADLSYRRRDLQRRSRQR